MAADDLYSQLEDTCVRWAAARDADRQMMAAGTPNRALQLSKLSYEKRIRQIAGQIIAAHDQETLHDAMEGW